LISDWGLVARRKFVDENVGRIFAYTNPLLPMECLADLLLEVDVCLWLLLYGRRWKEETTNISISILYLIIWKL